MVCVVIGVSDVKGVSDVIRVSDIIGDSGRVKLFEIQVPYHV